MLRFARNRGVAVTPTTSVLPSGSYTVVVLAELDAVDGYRRFLDVKNGTSDNGLYVADGYLYFYGGARGSGKVVKAHTYTQVVLTRNATTKVVTGYVDGKAQLSFTDTDGLATISGKNTLRLFRDNISSGASGEAAAGSVARVRLYSGALTAAQVAGLDRDPS